jgi:hypothetical protein
MRRARSPFLASATLAVAAITITVGAVELKSRDWQAAWVNMVGSIAFGVSAAGAFVRRSGVTEDAPPANVGTFLLILPNRWSAAVTAEVGA